MLDDIGGRQPESPAEARLTAPAAVPRLLPDEPFPPYTYVPGRTPHPFSDPQGHRHQLQSQPPSPPDPESWQRSRPFLYGVDLFNHGFYWEAHETWEGLWHAAGRKGVIADFLKGLIHLAAAGVKHKEGKPAGIQSHARRSGELFRNVVTVAGRERPLFMGLALTDLIRFSDDILQAPSTVVKTSSEGPVFSFVLRPSPCQP
jgi:hypothetical protein